VAHLAGGAWAVETVASISGGPGLPGQVTAIQVGSDGNPVVAFGANGTTKVATKTGGSWSVDQVSGSGGFGVSLALDSKGTAHVASYDANGKVQVARGGGSSWQVATIGQAAASAGGSGDARWGTGIAVGDNDAELVAWANTKANDIEVATGTGGQLQSQPVPSSTGGVTPSVATSADGKSAALAWYDATNQNLNVATPTSTGLTLAFSPPPVPTAGPTTQAAACSPGGTTVQVVAPSGAAGSGFAEKCYAAPAGKAFTISFSNDDPQVPHNFEIFTDSSASTRLGGAKNTADIVTGPAKATYDVTPLKAGTFYFQCDVHPTSMNGTFVVK
jgi:plastocyanin